MSQSNEKWLPVAGYAGMYEVSNHGRVRSLDRIVRVTADQSRVARGRILSPGPHRGGYKLINLSRDGHRKSATVHKLVLEAFVGTAPSGMEACHADGDPANNRLDNLRWGTSTENNFDIVRHGNHYQSNKTHCPRGHLLKLPNLVGARLRRGWRKCLSCDRAEKHARANGIPFTQEIADRYYSELPTVA